MSPIGLIFTVSGLVVLSVHGNYCQANEVCASLHLKKVGAECKNSIILIASFLLNMYVSVIFVYSLNVIIYSLKCFEYIL